MSKNTDAAKTTPEAPEDRKPGSAIQKPAGRVDRQPPAKPDESSDEPRGRCG